MMHFILLICSFSLFIQGPSLEVRSDSVTEVYIFLEEDCRISQFYTNMLNDLYCAYKDKNIEFTGVFPSQATKQKDITDFKDKYDIAFDLIFDRGQVLTKKFEATITPEVVVYSPVEDKIIYKGRIDDSYFRVGKRRNVVTSRELKYVLSRITQNKPVEIAWKAAIGCYIKLI